MSEEDDNGGDKEHDASPQKLAEARKKGDIPRSVDLLTAASIGGFVLALLWLGGWAVTQAGSAGMVLLDQSDRLSRLMASGAGGPLGGILLAFAGPPLALLILPPALVLVLIFATQSFLITPDKLLPKLSRISPIATAKQKFGTEGLVEFAKSTVKLGLVSAILYAFLAARFEDVIATLYLTPALATSVLSRLTIDFLVLVLLVSVALGGADYLWQLHLHRQRNRMSRKEMMDEFKESEGDPHFKAARRQRWRRTGCLRMSRAPTWWW